MDDVTHCFLQCAVFSNLRNRIGWIDWENFDFMHFFLRGNTNTHDTIYIKTLFAFWHMWLARNNAIFRNTTINSALIYQNIEETFCHYVTANKFPTCTSRSKRQLNHIAWSPSPFTEFKLNTDGASSSSTGMAGIGAIIRDNRGQFIKALAANIGIASNELAELWAIRDGLLMTKEQQIRKIHVETDSHTVFQMLHKDPMARQVHLKMVKDIRAIIKAFDEVWLSFFYREGNRVADALASLGKDTTFLYESFDHPPNFLLDVVRDDMYGKTINRITGGLCNMNIWLI